ncbi:hypothetical protein IC607_02175 [Cellulomonas sp. JH27-2]|uniref:hypothetical protein n=1 Tax=Cellulomonas sp. JH27-2 TaxID=2774139 RepID=UPI00177D33AE|nr:hypothetical protein [Cellulomonas sp. JH27-2]MBD8057775.1 hypothetical protein [Cellulomonas sp. JH27-2]
MRRTSVLLAAVAVATLTGTVLTSCAGSDPAQDQAQALVSFGGPSGWAADTVAAQPTDDTTDTTVDGVPVTMTAGDQPAGVQVRWVAPLTGSATDAACADLVAWFEHATREWPSTIDTSSMATTCADDAARTGDPVIAAGAGPAHGAYGRVTYEASVESGELVATLEFNARA